MHENEILSIAKYEHAIHLDTRFDSAVCECTKRSRCDQTRQTAPQTNRDQMLHALDALLIEFRVEQLTNLGGFTRRLVKIRRVCIAASTRLHGR